MSEPRADILEKILAVKREEIAAMLALGAAGGITKDLDVTRRRSLHAALRRAADQPMRVLSEVKRASPSAGPIRPDADPVAIAREYADAGAAAISVLTDKQFFAGDIAFLKPCHEAVRVPILRKDFLIDPIQIWEAANKGADAVLL